MSSCNLAWNLWEVRKRKHIMQKEVHKLQRKCQEEIKCVIPISVALMVRHWSLLEVTEENNFSGKETKIQAINYHFNASPHQKLDKPTSWISRKMQIGCRWLWPFSQKMYIGFRWTLSGLFILVSYTSCPNIMRIQFTNCNICWFQFPHFCGQTWIKMCCS